MSGGPLVFRQASHVQRPITFAFEADRLDYQGKEFGGSIRYEDIAPPIDYSEDNPAAWKVEVFAGFVCLLAAGTMRGMESAYGTSGFVKVALALAFVAVAIIAGKWVLRKVLFPRRTRIPTSSIEIVVDHDKNRDAIIAEIERRRMKSLRAMAKPDPLSTPEQERAKLAWLRTQNALDDEELQYFLDRIRSAA